MVVLTDKRRKDPLAPMPYVSARKLAAVIGCPEKAVPLLEKQGLLTIRQLPGGVGQKLYLLADAEKIKRLMIKPARDAQPAAKAEAKGKK